MGPYKKTETISNGINNEWQHLTECIKKTAYFNGIR